MYSAGVVLSYCCAYYEHTTLKYMAAFVIYLNARCWAPPAEYFLYAITKEFLIKEYSTLLIHVYCVVMLKRKLVVLAIFSSLKLNVFRPTQSGRSTIVSHYF